MGKHCNCHDVEPMYRQAVEPAVHWMIPNHPMYIPNQPPVPMGCCGPRMCPPPPMHNPCTYNGYIQAPHPYIYWMHTRKTTVEAGDNVVVDTITAENGDVTYKVNATLEEQEQKIESLQAAVASQLEMINTLTSDLATTNANVSANSDAIAAQGETIGSIGTRVDTAESNISANSESISTLNVDVAKTRNDVSANTEAITVQGAAISSMGTRVTTAESNISANATAIETNREGIAENKTNIASNKGEIDEINNTTLTSEDMTDSHIDDLIKE